MGIGESQRRGQKAICEGLASVAVVTPGLKESWREAEVCYQTEGPSSLQRGQEVKTGKGRYSLSFNGDASMRG